MALQCAVSCFAATSNHPPALENTLRSKPLSLSTKPMALLQTLKLQHEAHGPSTSPQASTRSPWPFRLQQAPKSLNTKPVIHSHVSRDTKPATHEQTPKANMKPIAHEQAI